MKIKSRTEHTIHLVKGMISKLSYNDPMKKVYNEPLLCGTDDVILNLGFKVGDKLTFGFANNLEDVPKYAIAIAHKGKLQENREQELGTWYSFNGVRFWLCRHLYDYCDEAPELLYLVPASAQM